MWKLGGKQLQRRVLDVLNAVRAYVDMKPATDADIVQWQADRRNEGIVMVEYDDLLASLLFLLHLVPSPPDDVVSLPPHSLLILKGGTEAIKRWGGRADSYLSNTDTVDCDLSTTSHVVILHPDALLHVTSEVCPPHRWTTNHDAAAFDVVTWNTHAYTPEEVAQQLDRWLTDVGRRPSLVCLQGCNSGVQTKLRQTHGSAWTTEYDMSGGSANGSTIDMLFCRRGVWQVVEGSYFWRDDPATVHGFRLQHPATNTNLFLLSVQASQGNPNTRGVAPGATHRRHPPSTTHRTRRLRRTGVAKLAVQTDGGRGGVCCG